MQGAAGMVVQPEGFLRRARAVADRVGALLVLDEVATGFGRSGRMFACQTEERRSGSALPRQRDLPAVISRWPRR